MVSHDEEKDDDVPVIYGEKLRNYFLRDAFLFIVGIWICVCDQDSCLVVMSHKMSLTM